MDLASGLKVPFNGRRVTVLSLVQAKPKNGFETPIAKNGYWSGINSQEIYPPRNFPHIKAKSNEPRKISLKGQALV